jgi:hypothetical protein
MKTEADFDMDPPFSSLPDVARYALERCVDRLENGEYLPREVVDGCEAYAYRHGDGKIARGINGKYGNIWRDLIDG